MYIIIGYVRKEGTEVVHILGSIETKWMISSWPRKCKFIILKEFENWANTCHLGTSISILETWYFNKFILYYWYLNNMHWSFNMHCTYRGILILWHHMLITKSVITWNTTTIGEVYPKSRVATKTLYKAAKNFQNSNK